MKTLKPTISVGIAAYNEENNIQNILRDVLKQKQTDWKLSEVIVYCDGCTDKTVDEIKQLRSPKIRTLGESQRRGKSFGLNQICKTFVSDTIVLFDADIRLGNNNVISNLVRELYKSDMIQVAGGNSIPFKPKNFVENAVYSTFEVFYASRKTIKGGHNIFGCTGACIAMKNIFAKNLHIPNVINDDDFIYFSCIKKGYIFRHVSNAKVYYRLPKTVQDYVRQNIRSNPNAVDVSLFPYFGTLVQNEYYRPIGFYLKEIFKVFINNPGGVFFIIGVNLIFKPLYGILTRNYHLGWYTAKTTK